MKKLINEEKSREDEFSISGNDCSLGLASVNGAALFVLLGRVCMLSFL